MVVICIILTTLCSSGIIFSLNDKSSSSNLKIDALACLHVIMVTHPAHAFHAHVPALVPPVVACVGDPFYKITSEALLVTQQLVKVGVHAKNSSEPEMPQSFQMIPFVPFSLFQVIRPLDSQPESSESFDPSPYINDFFTCTIRRLKAADIDQEVKERAISCMGQIICNLGNNCLLLYIIHDTDPCLTSWNIIFSSCPVA